MKKTRLIKRHSEKTKEKIRQALMGNKNPRYGKKVSEKTKIKISNGMKGRKLSNDHKLKISKALKGSIPWNRFTLNYIKNNYLFFAKLEEMIYNPDKPEEIQVHCKNHNCPNSKEKGGWFTPTSTQLYERLRALEKPHGMIENNFYCSDDCKNKCPLYKLCSDPYKETSDKSYTQKEYNQFREYVLERDDYKCQYCGEKAEHVHHERPQKLEPFFALDVDYAWSVCKKCHYKYGHKDECSTGNLSHIHCS